MVCICDEPGLQAAEERRLRVFARLGLVQMEDLVTAVLLSLAFDFECSGAGVYADMWFGVSVSTKLAPEDGLFVQCDDVADGLLVLWERLAQLAPERVTSNPVAKPEQLEVAKRVSEVLMRNYREVEHTYREHRKAAHSGGNDCPPCVDCEVGMSLRAHAMHTLERAWGGRVLDAVVEEAWDC